MIMRDKITNLAILCVFSVLLAGIYQNTALGQHTTESRVGINYGIEVFEYIAQHNEAYIKKLPADTSPIITPIFDLFYHTYNRNIMVGGSAGIRWGRMDKSFKVYQLNLDMVIGIGTRYVDIYFGIRGRLWYEFKQKSYRIHNSNNDYYATGDIYYHPVDGNQISFSYASLVGVRIYFIHSINFTIELGHNFYVDQTKEWESPNYAIPFSSVKFEPIGIKASIGLNLPDWWRDYHQ